MNRLSAKAVLVILIVISTVGLVCAGSGVSCHGAWVSAYDNMDANGYQFEVVAKAYDSHNIILYWSAGGSEPKNFEVSSMDEKVDDYKTSSHTDGCYYVVVVTAQYRTVVAIPAEYFQNIEIKEESGLVYVSNMGSKWYEPGAEKNL